MVLEGRVELSQSTIYLLEIYSLVGELIKIRKGNHIKFPTRDLAAVISEWKGKEHAVRIGLVIG